MREKRTTAPASDFITVAEAATNVFGNATYDATKLARDIKAVISEAEQYTERAFINQVWTFTLDNFPVYKDINPRQAIYIPKGRLVSVDSVNYYDSAGVDQTLVEDTDFYVDTVGDNARLVPLSGGWPDVSEYRPDAITIVATLGYGTSLPAEFSDIKDACLLRIGDLYEMRQSKFANYSVVSNSKMWMGLLKHYKIFFDFNKYND